MKWIVALYIIASVSAVSAAWITSGGGAALATVAVFAFIALIGVAITKGIDSED